MPTQTITRRMKNHQPLWLLSFVIAMSITLLLLLGIGFLLLRNQLVAQSPTIFLPPQEQVVIVMANPESVAPVPDPETPKPPASKPSSARTSSDQASAQPEKADFIGERDTIATSDALPVAGAPLMPSQDGREPRRPGEIETTESKVQDGALEHDRLAKSSPSDAPLPPSKPMPEDQPKEISERATTAPVDTTAPSTIKEPEKTKVMANKESPSLPGDEIVERATAEETPPQPQMADHSAPEPSEKAQTEKAELPKPATPTKPDEPGFRGNQTKTKLSGSITRKGRSALNVANTPMGRYHSALSRAVEAEWHKNCTKYRDFITPGILTVRFVIAPDSSVRTISVVEMIDAGEVQKGFTLSAIRQAKIPPIPNDLKAEIDDEPIELVYNFYF